MTNKNQEFNAFPDFYIDAISENPDNNFFTPILDELLVSIPKPDLVCDVGCGNGVFTIDLKKRIGCQLHGVDGSEYAVAKAKSIGFNEVHLVSDFCSERLPFADDSFDLVICKDVLEHLLDPEFLMKEIVRITKPDGRCLVHVPNHFPIIGRLRFLFSNNIDTFNYFPESNRWNFPHIRFFNKRELILLGRRCGAYPEVDFSWHFFRPARIAKIFPLIAKLIGNRYSDQTSEGVTILFKK